MTQIKVTVKFLSDWHVGSGDGRPGDIDRLFRRDDRGLPHIPAKSLAGMWRDAAETLADALQQAHGDDQTPNWTNWIDVLFGSRPSVERNPSVKPTAARLRVGDARLPRDLRQSLGDCPKLARGLAYVAPSVSIDPLTGAAKEDHFFLTEFVRLGAELTAEAALADVNDNDKDRVGSFLAAAAEGIRAIGSKRRRGRGKCQTRVEIDGKPIKNATTDFFASAGECPSIPAAKGHDDSLAEKGADAGKGEWRSWALQVDTLEPVLAYQNTSGNVVTSLDHIPGALLLAALNGQLKRRDGVSLFPSVAQDALQVRNAYPGKAGTQASDRKLPTPICLFRAKHGDALSSRLASDVDSADSTQWKQLRAGFVPATLTTDAPLPIATTAMQFTTHNVIADAQQTPTEEVGGVYTYEAIASTQTFVSRVVLRRGSPLDQMLQEWLDNESKIPVTLGRARRSGYGKAQLSVAETEPDTPAPAHEDRFAIWLASPMLLLDDTLMPLPRLANLAKDLARQLDVHDVRLLESQCWLHSTRRESWHNAWGLPRPSLVGWQSGSVLMVEAPGVTPDALARLALHGLGERRAEGFGELVVNPVWLMQPPKTWQRVTSQALSATQAPRPDDLRLLRKDGEFATTVLRNAARQWLDETIAALSLPPWLEVDEGAAGLVGALRTVAATAPVGEVATRVTAYHSYREHQISKAAAALAATNSDGDPLHALLIIDATNWIDDPLWNELRDEALRTLLVTWCQSAHRARDLITEPARG